MMRLLTPEEKDLLLSDESDRETAARKGEKVETIRTRKKRAKQRLRRSLVATAGTLHGPDCSLK